MKNFRTVQKDQFGQSIVLVVFAMMGMVALLVLTLDGGYALMYRRMAQAAADAGAFAGARTLCGGGTNDDVNAIVANYTITNNEMDGYNLQISNDVVTVDTSKTFTTFFAPMLGQPSITVNAEAAAGCFAPGFSEGVLPTAWNCSAPQDGSTFISDSGECVMQRITLDELEIFKTDPYSVEARKHIYLILDSEPTGSVYCGDNGTLECDLDGDGVDDILGDGGRAWLDLDGGNGGVDELVSWIIDGFPDPINTHSWIPSQEGRAESVFHAAYTRVGDIVIVPVFDARSPENPSLNGYIELIHPDPNIANLDIILAVSSNQFDYYHITGFAAFYISCVNAAGVIEKGKSTCAGSTDQGGILERNGYSWIEGYFIEGFVSGIGGKPMDGIDTGLFTVFLTQ